MKYKKLLTPLLSDYYTHDSARAITERRYSDMNLSDEVVVLPLFQQPFYFVLCPGYFPLRIILFQAKLEARHRPRWLCR